MLRPDQKESIQLHQPTTELIIEHGYAQPKVDSVRERDFEYCHLVDQRSKIDTE